MAEARAAERIAVLLHTLESGGGAQRRVVELVNGFAAAGRAVDLHVVQPGELRSLVSPQVRVFEVDGSALRDHLKCDPPDALLAGAAAIHGLAVRSMPRPRSFPLILRASSHPFRALPWSMPWQKLREQARRRPRIARYREADLVIAVSQDVAASIKRALPLVRVIVSNDPVVTDRFLAGADAPITLPWPSDTEIPLILGIGRLALAKDFPTLLRAFALLRATRPARLAILGGGSAGDRESLLRLARKLGIQADLALPGETGTVAAWLHNASLFVSSSLWEGSSGALIEALAMGCPAVATSSVGSAVELLRNGELGAIVPAGDPSAMAAAMAAQLDRPPESSRLVAAASPYRDHNQAADYLAAIDACVRDFRR
ncbi:glycosyltransferase [Sphingomonas sp.]|uniref:glycosyltransferase n=1 Tax=Sphingomonas sp. TaxID=28214 RepID=UPI0025F97F16|nr:glycosyltransferase [Sphingomonas sp.]MBV9527818.1 glycosyltransferase [Sphingomonas sp.]